MDLKNLTTFICCAELHSFTKAAEKLGYTQSTVSFQIKQLEQELGVPLFDRINHSVSLTAYGVKLLQTATQINTLLTEMKNSEPLDERVQGHVRVAVADSLCEPLFGSVFADLHSNYPGITIEIITSETEGMFRMLNHNDVDIVCTMDSHIYNANVTILQEKQIAAHFVASAEAEIADPVSAEELTELPLMLTERNMSYRKQVDDMLARKGVYLKPILETGNTGLLCDLVRKNAGISFLPDFCTQKYVSVGEMRYLNVPDVKAEVWLQLLCHKEKWVSPSMQIVIDHLIRAWNELS